MTTSLVTIAAEAQRAAAEWRAAAAAQDAEDAQDAAVPARRSELREALRDICRRLALGAVGVVAAAAAGAGATALTYAGEPPAHWSAHTYQLADPCAPANPYAVADNPADFAGWVHLRGYGDALYPPYCMGWCDPIPLVNLTGEQVVDLRSKGWIVDPTGRSLIPPTAC